MSIGYGTAGANTALDALVAAYPYAKPHVGDPGAAGTSNAATETTRKQVSWGAASGATVSSNAETQWTGVAVTGATEDWTHFSFWSASSGGSFGFSINVTLNPVASGNTVTFASGDIDVTQAVAT